MFRTEDRMVHTQFLPQVVLQRRCVVRQTRSFENPLFKNKKKVLLSDGCTNGKFLPCLIQLQVNNKNIISMYPSLVYIKPVNSAFARSDWLLQTQDSVCYWHPTIFLDFAREFFGQFFTGSKVTNWGQLSPSLVYTKTIIHLTSGE